VCYFVCVLVSRIFEIDPNVIVNRISMATQEECDLPDQKAFNQVILLCFELNNFFF
jgi:hypothetical protein